MPYVQRNENGKIVKVSTRGLVGGEVLPYSHPEITAFLRQRGQDPQLVEQAMAELRRTDNDMARAVEDVIMILLKKNVVKMTDLPKPVQDRISYRVKQRVLIQDIYDQATARVAE
ncbi:MAG: hypothetical protein PHS57_05450 [Alphaproteobacteria bacterium]|nr:hypothetical protein [Alphaproteobacteria bacterium]